MELGATKVTETTRIDVIRFCVRHGDGRNVQRGHVKARRSQRARLLRNAVPGTQDGSQAVLRHHCRQQVIPVYESVQTTGIESERRFKAGEQVGRTLGKAVPPPLIPEPGILRFHRNPHPRPSVSRRVQPPPLRPKYLPAKAKVPLERNSLVSKRTERCTTSAFAGRYLDLRSSLWGGGRLQRRVRPKPLRPGVILADRPAGGREVRRPHVPGRAAGTQPLRTRRSVGLTAAGKPTPNWTRPCVPNSGCNCRRTSTNAASLAYARATVRVSGLVAG